MISLKNGLWKWKGRIGQQIREKKRVKNGNVGPFLCTVLGKDWIID